MRSSRDVVDTQLVELQSNADRLNEELAEVLTMEAGLREGIRQMDGDASKVEDVRDAQEQLEKELIRKNNLLTEIASVEANVAKKEKELKAKKK